MNKQTGQRIVGAILLLLLAAIVTPFLLRSPEQVRVALDMELPEPPAAPTLPIVPTVSDQEVAEAQARIDDERDQVRREGEAALTPATPETDTETAGTGRAASAGPETVESGVAESAPAEQAEASDPAATGEPEAPRVVAPESVAPEDDPVLSGWAVQVGSFSRPEGAAELASSLRDAGYRAFTRPFTQGEQRLHRVYLGPELVRERATQLRERIAEDDAFALQGLVVSLGP